MKTSTATLVTLLTLFIVTYVNAQEYDQRPAAQPDGHWYQPAQPADQAVQGTDPFIVSTIAQINPDTMRATLQRLQDFGTRFMLADNRKEVAEWIADRFRAYGYAEVKLDSFLNYLNWGGGIFVDTTWQYNVICNLRGASAPGEMYVVGGHYDSYCSGDPYTFAPGVNDNGTAVAATLEMARIMAKEGYVPEMTISFTLFAAEELGLCGSMYQAARARETGEDVRYYLNMDMISNNPDSTRQVKVYRYLMHEWAGDLMADVFTRYTDLQVHIPGELIATGSDSFSYWMNNFPTAYLEEYHFSPNWHKPGDVIANCNIAYCADIARGAMATLMEMQRMPYPQGIAAASSPEGVTISWKPEGNANVAGTNIYRSENPHNGFEKINPSPVADSLYLDASVVAGNEYFYRITFAGSLQGESLPSTVVIGARYAFSDTLLVVSWMKGDKTTPDSVIAFYDAILDTIPHKWVDASASRTPNLGLIASSKNILWVMNSTDTDIANDTLAQKFYSFFENGGNMMMAGFLPTRFFYGNLPNNFCFPEDTFIYQYFKIDSVYKKLNSLMYRAYPDHGGYDTLRVDPGKWMDKNLPGEIYYIEVFTAAPGGTPILRFDSHYPPGNPLGAMQGKVVGVENMGDDFRTILLSFPLWYLDTTDARNLMKYVMREKFTHPVGIPGEPGKRTMAAIVNYPNPFHATTTVRYTLAQPQQVTLSLYDSRGRLVRTFSKGHGSAGEHTFTLHSAGLAPGIYYLRLEGGSTVQVAKIAVM